MTNTPNRTDDKAGQPVAYGVQSNDDGSLSTKIAPTGYMMFGKLMEDLKNDPWVTAGRASIVPLYSTQRESLAVAQALERARIAMCAKCSDGDIPEFQPDPIPTWWHDAVECCAAPILRLIPVDLATEARRQKEDAARYCAIRRMLHWFKQYFSTPEEVDAEVDAARKQAT